MLSRFHLGVAGVALVLAAGHTCVWGQLKVAPVASTDGRWHETSIEEYRAHLVALSAVVDGCAKGREVKSCDPMQVGLDDQVPLGNERRLVRYGWLRVLLSLAEDKDQPVEKPVAATKGNTDQDALPTPPTTTELLQAAKTRLDSDWTQAGTLASGRADSGAASGHADERAAMTAVLAGREFRNLEAPTARDAALEKLGIWLNWIFERVGRLRTRSKWVGRAVVGAFILAVCVALVWGLIQLERRWRIQLVPEDVRQAGGYAAARDWQLWLDDAQRAAAAGAWRDAIHCAYWAAIARLESKRVWPADRARTPREYLALVRVEDPRRAGLAALTGSFERVWYGGREAGEGDYRRAEETAAALIAGKSGGGGA